MALHMAPHEALHEALPKLCKALPKALLKALPKSLLEALLEALSLPLVVSYERRTVREHQNQKYAYGQGALILLILLASSYR
jgi:hypothetical protein